jgi:hypothetical protein
MLARGSSNDRGTLTPSMLTRGTPARNDDIPEILGEVRNATEKRALDAKYNNFNNNLRATIADANCLVAQGKLVVVVATGDLVDYYHDGVFAWDNRNATWSKSNYAALRKIITGADGKAQALRCPIFTVLGNHDYLQHEWHLCLDFNFLGQMKPTSSPHIGGKCYFLHIVA